MKIEYISKFLTDNNFISKDSGIDIPDLKSYLTLKNSKGYTPIRQAAKNGDWELVQYFASNIKCLDYNLKNDNDQFQITDTLFCAIEAKEIDIVNLIINNNLLNNSEYIWKFINLNEFIDDAISLSILKLNQIKNADHNLNNKDRKKLHKLIKDSLIKNQKFLITTLNNKINNHDENNNNINDIRSNLIDFVINNILKTSISKLPKLFLNKNRSTKINLKHINAIPQVIINNFCNQRSDSKSNNSETYLYCNMYARNVSSNDLNLIEKQQKHREQIKNSKLQQVKDSKPRISSYLPLLESRSNIKRKKYTPSTKFSSIYPEPTNISDIQLSLANSIDDRDSNSEKLPLLKHKSCSINYS